MAREDWWLDDERKVFLGNIPADFSEDRLLDELRQHEIRPVKIRYRARSDEWGSSNLDCVFLKATRLVSTT